MLGIIGLTLGFLILLASIVSVLYYIFAEKGELGLPIVGVCLSLLLIGGSLGYIFYISSTKAAEKEMDRSISIIRNNSLRSTPKKDFRY